MLAEQKTLFEEQLLIRPSQLTKRRGKKRRRRKRKRCGLLLAIHPAHGKTNRALFLSLLQAIPGKEKGEKKGGSRVLQQRKSRL